MSDWQPIETAPKDGTWIMVRNADGQEQTAFYFGKIHPRDGYLMTWVGNHRSARDSTHWKPLITD